MNRFYVIDEDGSRVTEGYWVSYNNAKEAAEALESATGDEYHVTSHL